MQQMTPQEQFDTVLFGLRQQGIKSSNGNRCLYRGPNGTKCAAGLCIPDEVFVPEMEEAGTVSRFTPSMQAQVPFSCDSGGLMRELQMLHDTYMPRPDSSAALAETMRNAWEQQMQEVAKR